MSVTFVTSLQAKVVNLSHWRRRQMANRSLFNSHAAQQADSEMTALIEYVTEDSPSISISRQVYNSDNFDEKFKVYRAAEDGPSSADQALSFFRSMCPNPCSVRTVGHRLLGFLPFIAHLRSYKWKKWLFKDLIAGLSGGVLHFPQGLGFALLAGLPPAYGLYTSFFPGLLYYFFGTSRHISIGTMALSSLMIGTVVNREYAAFPVPHGPATLPQSTANPLQTTVTTPFSMNESYHHYFNLSNGSMPVVNNDDVARKVGVAVSVTLLAGLVQLVMRVFSLGILTTYMSMPFIGSFMAGSALQIMVSQLPFMLGVSIQRPPDTFQLPLTVYQIFKNIKTANICSIIISLICITFIVGMKEGVNEKYRNKLKMPVPIEIIVVIVATIISYFAKLKSRFNIALIGTIPMGFPPPAVPPMTNFLNYLTDAIILAIISFVVSIAMAQMMAKRHYYQLDTNQEVLAYAITNTISPFFGAFVSSQAPPRTLVHEATGGKTQLTGLISILLPLVVILGVGPLFEPLPTCVLGCIVSCCLIPLMKQFGGLCFMWKVNKFDFFVWVVTFLSTSMVSIMVGLIAGIALNVYFVLLNAQLAKGYVMTQADDTEIYYHSKSDKVDLLKKLRQSEINVFRYDGGEFCFATVESFKNQLYKETVDPTIKKKSKKKKVDNNEYCETDGGNSVSHECVTVTCEDQSRGTDHVPQTTIIASEEREGSTGTCRPSSGEGNHTGGEDQRTHRPIAAVNGEMRATEESKIQEEISTNFWPSPRRLILDFSTVCYVDIVGLNTIKQLVVDYKSVGVEIVLACCSDELSRQLKLFGLRGPESEAGSGAMNDNIEIYPTIHDAVVASRHRLHSRADNGPASLV